MNVTALKTGEVPDFDWTTTVSEFFAKPFQTSHLSVVQRRLRRPEHRISSNRPGSSGLQQSSKPSAEKTSISGSLQSLEKNSKTCVSYSPTRYRARKISLRQLSSTPAEWDAQEWRNGCDRDYQRLFNRRVK